MDTAKSKKSYEMDMTSGSILKKMIIFAIPLILTNLMQALFHSADVLVLGICVEGELGDMAMAAVGTNSALINLILGLFIGVSMGANVTVAKYIGKKDFESVQKHVGVSILFGLISGLAVMLVGFFGARIFLTLLKCDQKILGLAVTYLQIYALGFPIMMVYNFASAILRASGDTLRPLVYLIIGGVLNLLLNLFFVLALNKTVEGVAIATIVSQAVSATLAIISLMKNKSGCKLKLKHIRFYLSELKEILYIGLPMGLQSCLFSLSNVLIQSNVNGFGEYATAGNSAGSQIDDLVWQFGRGISLAVLSFTGQNYGAGDYKRIVKIKNTAIILQVTGVLGIGLIFLAVSPIILDLVVTSPIAKNYAYIRLTVTCLTYFICGIMDTYSSSLRGMGRSIIAMVITLLGACVLRIVWLKVMELTPIYSYLTVMLSWPISWVITTVVYMIVYKKVINKNLAEQFEIKG